MHTSIACLFVFYGISLSCNMLCLYKLLFAIMDPYY